MDKQTGGQADGYTDRQEDKKRHGQAERRIGRELDTRNIKDTEEHVKSQIVFIQRSLINSAKDL